jgi:hypothetical protein
MPRVELMTWWRMLTVLIATLAATPVLQAQLFDEEKPKGDGSMPTFSGKGKVTEAINSDTGAIFDIGGGVTLMFPKGLPVGRSRLVTLQKARGGVPTRLIAGFKPVGPALEFTGAFNTSGKPIVLALSTKQNPTKRGQKLVVAMEVGTFCEQENKAFKLKSGLCSGFELHDAEYDAADKRLLAKLRSTGGLRMQFGLVPETSEGDEGGKD